MIRQCSNTTCDRQFQATVGRTGRPADYCSQACRERARWPHNRMHLNRVSIPMSVYHRIAEQAKLAGTTFEEECAWLLFLASEADGDGG